MESTVLVALISGCCSLLGTFAGVVVSNNLTQYRLEQLEKKVEEYSELIVRTFKLEEQSALQNEKMKAANHRIDDLEKHLDRKGVLS